MVWRLYASMFAIFAIGALVMGFAIPGLDPWRATPFSVALAAVAVAAFCTSPPPLGTAGNHAVVASVAVFVAIGLVALKADSPIALPPAMFLAPLAAVRLRSHAQIAAHCLGGGFVLAVPALLGLISDTAALAVFTLIPAIWLAAVCVVIILDAAEAQGIELERMVRHDPLTGVGNRRLLDEQLAHELEVHAQSGRPLSVLALDLNGFKALNDAVGHSAGDAVLQEVASALRATARPQDTVVRQGGDEFCLLLPDTTPEQARFTETALRTSLARLAGGQLPITTGVGVATYPLDADTADALLELADARLGDDKQRGDGSDPRLDGHSVHVPVPAFAAAAAEAAAAPATLITRVSRRDLSRNPYLWFATGLVFVAYAVLSGACALLVADAPVGALALPAVALAGAAMIFVTRQGPSMNSVLNHAMMVAFYGGTVAFMAVFPSVASAGLCVTLIIGPQIAVRLIDRRIIVAHLTAATLAFTPLVLLGVVDLSMSVTLLVMVPSIWGLGLICMVVLEASEAQGEELERLVRRDPLTGAGNRRMLNEDLAEELVAHSRIRQPLTVLALDLNGFKPLNDTFGHAAGDQLLCDVVAAIRRVVNDSATVARQGGDEFCVLLPNTSGDAALPVAEAIRGELATIDAHGATVTTGIGIASYPTEGGTAEELLEVADQLLRASKEMEYARLRRGREREGSAQEAA